MFYGEFSFIWGSDVVLLLVLTPILFSLIRENRMRRFDSKVLFYLVFTQIILIVSDIFSYHAVSIGNSQLSIWMVTLSYILSKGIIFLFILYQVYSFRQRTYVSEGVVYFAAFLSGAACILWIIGLLQPQPWFVGLDAGGALYSTAIYWMIFLLPSVALLFSFFLTISCRQYFRNSEIFTWLSYIVMPVLAGILDIFLGTAFSNTAFGITLVMLYTNIYIEQIRAIEIKEKELSQSSNRLMVSQIQPHFMYNSLNSIYYLIGKDPELAQEAVSTFSDYLRQNINSIKTDKPVHFAEEIGHTKAYVYLEKLRFGDVLNVIFDIQADQFLIPPLTVQPLVENAIKHGVMQRESGGTVKILAHELADAFEIIIADDGVGFNARGFQDSEGHTHIGILSVHNRLKLMCGGSLEVKSQPDAGTICTIRIPKEASLA